MSFFTWIGASVGCILAHFNVISFDFLHIKAESQSTQFNLLKSLSQDAIRIPLNIFMCTLSGALLGLLSLMTWDVSFPSLVVFSASSIVTSKYCTRLFSSAAIGCTQEKQDKEQEKECIDEESNEEEVDDQRQEVEENNLHITPTVSSRRASLNYVKTLVSSLAFWEKMELIAYVSEKAGNEGYTSSTVPDSFSKTDAEESLLGPESDEGYTSSTVEDKQEQKGTSSTVEDKQEQKDKEKETQEELSREVEEEKVEREVLETEDVQESLTRTESIVRRKRRS